MTDPKNYLIFYCSQDNAGQGCWIVAVDKGNDVWHGVAECPDEHTARAVLKAMRGRELEKMKETHPMQRRSIMHPLKNWTPQHGFGDGLPDVPVEKPTVQPRGPGWGTT